MTTRPNVFRLRAKWHVIYNLDGTFRGYEWALDANGNERPSLVYAQEGRDDHGKPLASR